MTESPEESPLPLVAPCRQLTWNAAFDWLALGWRDLRRAPATSLGYGAIMVLLSYAITAAAWTMGNAGLYLGLLSGFVFLGPVLALTLYAVSTRLDRGRPVSLAATLRDARGVLSDAMVFALVLLIVFLVWARAAAMVHIFFPLGGDPTLVQWLTFFGTGSAIGAGFCALIFMASAFSLPMMLDRKADTVTAVITSINATLRNKPAMLIWATCIGAFVLIGIATAYLGFAILLPWLGHAAWHGYRETIDATAWPGRPLN